MSVSFFIGLLGGLLVLAYVANQLFHRTRVPDVIVLMAAGVLLGPVSGWLQPTRFQPVAHALGTLAVILILFEGGLDLDLRDTLRHFGGGFLLSLSAYLFSVALIGLVLGSSAGLDKSSSLLIAAVLACSSSAIMLPVLQQLEISKPARITLLLDASLSDTFAVLSVGILLNLNAAGSFAPALFLKQFVYVMGLSLLFAGFAAALWSFILPAVSEKRFWNILTFSAVLLIYAGTERLGASGLVAVLGFGIALANIRRIDPQTLETALGLATLGEERHTQMLTFHSELAFLVRSFFFVLIGVLVRFEALVKIAAPVLGVVGAIILARWLAVVASRWSWREFPPIDRELPLWIMPRGLITIVLALHVAEVRGNEFTFLPDLAFAAILATSLLVVIGSVRARRSAKVPEYDPQVSELSTRPES